MDSFLFHSTSKRELIRELKKELLNGFRDVLQEQHRENTHQKEWLSVKEVSDLLKISQVTVHAWSKTGRLQKHRLGSRVRFRKDEVLHALKKIETK